MLGNYQVASQVLASRAVLNSKQLVDFSGLFSVVPLKVFSVQLWCGIYVEGEESYHILAFWTSFLQNLIDVSTDITKQKNGFTGKADTTKMKRNAVSS
jgi:hypothetical protein